jgi:hypothetical protein
MQLTSAENSRAAIRATENVRSSSEIGRPFQLKGAGGPERGESPAQPFARGEAIVAKNRVIWIAYGNANRLRTKESDGVR